MEDFGSKASFEVVPAVLGTMCADELDCAYESATLCAFDLGGDAAAAATGAGTTAASFAFLECMDSAGKFPLFYDPTPVQACASKQGLDYTKLSKCANGTKADALLKAAQKTVTAACGKEANLPTVLVGGRKVCESDKCTYAAVAAALKGLEETASVAPAPALSLRGASNNATAVGGEPAIAYFFASQ